MVHRLTQGVEMAMEGVEMAVEGVETHMKDSRLGG